MARWMIGNDMPGRSGSTTRSKYDMAVANIRERLQLLYGPKASLTVAENQPSGTIVTITVPYTHRDSEGNAA